MLQNTRLQLEPREPEQRKVSSLYDSLSQLQKRLQDFAEAGKDPRTFRLADMEPDIETRVFLIKKKLQELKDVKLIDRASC